MRNITTNTFHSLIWISASAGTGKTRILVNRVLKLLITGHQNILCLTFTNAAAYEMTERIHSTLSAWTTLTDTELKTDLQEIIQSNITVQELHQARRLFNSIHNISLSIKTIHSFCYQLISAFPIEAGISPNCIVKDLSESFPKIFYKTLNDVTIKHNISAISSEITEKTLYDLLYKLLSNQDYNPNQDLIYHKLNCNITQIKKSPNINQSNLIFLIKALSKGSTRDQKISNKLTAWMNLSEKYKIAKLNEYTKIFINSTSLEKKSISSIITKKTLNDFPQIEKIIIDIQEEILEFTNTFYANKIAERTVHLTEIAKCFTKLYQQNKQRLNYLDHDDVINLALKLLINPHYKDWILFHLDSKIDHVLVDESQDNSIKQWQIISELCQDFFTGIGTTEETKTLFIVGDIKQSIYSFQNARPDYFKPMCNYFAQKSNQYKILYLKQSFRSTAPILKLVDKIFNNFRQEISFTTEAIHHEIFRKHDPGYLEIWPIFHTENNKYNFLENTDHKITPDTNLLLASTIANKIHTWIKNQRILPAKQRTISAGDILILVRHRTSFIDHMITELKKLNIPTLERDKFKVMDSIIIQDLVNLGEFLLLPENDLALAGLLKSPIFEFTEEQIFNLAYNRNNLHLWEVLQLKFSYISDYLKQLINISQTHNPLDTYNYIISQHKHKFIKRLGQSNIEEIIGEFINLLIKFELDHVNSLQAFIHWIKNTNPEIKSDINHTKNYIKIMTIHNAKGMQSPIVFLTDTTTIPKSDLQLIFDTENTPFWCRNDTHDFCEKLKTQQKINEYNEYLRLLYVAMTRAEDELYITGTPPIQSKSWYNIIYSISGTYKKKYIDLQPLTKEKAEVLYLDE
ncbi:exodeoxyribonuclease V beta chain [Ehrlichia ruminantium]|uniref:UvrD-helicase domain-containing protein n=1 Tax=Ehrlichia ruminantium TaxID=779 RepID=UPI0007C11BA5|nr:UvrD-helicase domain-containing protein [Ehrlichia ruminantium]QLK52553.1 exodeoxyribonuclease V subunit beta [Ehrlichia ruminantium]QLK54383.1 exodeoxyribonuclease V subunit beta [Ehrlichia ruminantium]GAT76476.1 exodeoxyribonuclease V beta chain [Ehrlichia ruminantium]